MASKMWQAVPAFLPSALAASKVGTWERDPEAGLIRCDSAMAAMFGITEDEAAHGLTLEQFGDRIHPDDRHLFLDRVEQSRKRGGLIVVEYRILAPSGEERWLQVRGRYTALQPEQVIAAGQGIVIDITETKHGRLGEGCASCLSNEDHRGTSLETAADHAIAARRAIDEHDPWGTSPLRPLIDGLLEALGRALAAESLEVGTSDIVSRRRNKADGVRH